MLRVASIEAFEAFCNTYELELKDTFEFGGSTYVLHSEIDLDWEIFVNVRDRGDYGKARDLYIYCDTEAEYEDGRGVDAVAPNDLNTWLYKMIITGVVVFELEE